MFPVHSAQVWVIEDCRSESVASLMKSLEKNFLQIQIKYCDILLTSWWEGINELAILVFILDFVNALISRCDPDDKKWPTFTCISNVNSTNRNNFISSLMSDWLTANKTNQFNQTDKDLYRSHVCTLHISSNTVKPPTIYLLYLCHMIFVTASSL